MVNKTKMAFFFRVGHNRACKQKIVSGVCSSRLNDYTRATLLMIFFKRPHEESFYIAKDQSPLNLKKTKNGNFSQLTIIRMVNKKLCPVFVLLVLMINIGEGSCLLQSNAPTKNPFTLQGTEPQRWLKKPKMEIFSSWLQ